MNVKEHICRRLNEADYHPLTIAELLVELELDGFDAYHAEKAIRTLEREHRLTVTKKGKLLPLASSPIRQATFRATNRGFGFADVKEEDGRISTFFISSKERHFAIHGDEVLIRILNLPKGDKEGDARIEQVLSHTKTELMGTIEKKKFYNKKKRPVWVLSPDDRRFGTEIEIDLHGSLPFHERDKVLVSFTAYPGPFCGLRGKVIKVFGKGDRANYEAILYQNGISRHFPKEVLAEADTVSQMEVSSQNRLDLRNEHPYGVIFTIDGEHAKDLDDAVSVAQTERGTYLLGVHIADVAEYVRANTPCDREAMERGCSVYFVDQVVPMLPASLSNGSCSLHPGVDRYALSALMELDEQGNLVSLDLRESVLRTQIRGVYHEVNDLLEKGEASAFAQKYALLFPNTLPLLQKVFEILERKSQKRGMLELETVQTRFVLDADGYPVDVQREERGVAERIIEQFMLMANEAVATFLKERALPCVYRVHETPAQEKLQAFAQFAHQSGLDIGALPPQADKLHPRQFQSLLKQAKEKEIAEPISMVMLRSMAKAKYSPTPARHFGLGIENYCHFTSPIRRYPDLSVHRILKSHLRSPLSDKEKARFFAFTQKSAIQSTDAELRAMNAEREIEALYQILFLQPQLGKQFDGIVTGMTEFGIFVRMNNTCEGFVPLHSIDEYAVFSEETLSMRIGRNTYHLADRVRVRLIEADPDTRRITLQLLPMRERKEG